MRHYDSPYLVYHEKVKTSRVFIRDCSMVCVYPMVLFGGGQVNVELQRGEFIISLDDGWIKFAAASHEVKQQVNIPLILFVECQKCVNRAHCISHCEQMCNAFNS